MDALIAFVRDPLFHKIAIALLGYWVFSAAVGALPALTPTSGKVYGFTYRFLHLFAANLKNFAVRFNVPGDQSAGQ